MDAAAAAAAAAAVSGAAVPVTAADAARLRLAVRRAVAAAPAPPVGVLPPLRGRPELWSRGPAAKAGLQGRVTGGQGGESAVSKAHVCWVHGCVRARLRACVCTAAANACPLPPPPPQLTAVSPPPLFLTPICLRSVPPDVRAQLHLLRRGRLGQEGRRSCVEPSRRTGGWVSSCPRADAWSKHGQSMRFHTSHGRHGSATLTYNIGLLSCRGKLCPAAPCSAHRL